MRRSLSYLAITMIIAGCAGMPGGSIDPRPESLHINQIGFYPALEKGFVTADLAAASFEVRKTDPGSEVGYRVIHRGNIDRKNVWSGSGEPAGIGDLSVLTEEGDYTLRIGGSAAYPVTVSRTLYADALKTTMKSYYFQRASTGIDKKHAGDQWYRDSGHPDLDLRFDPVSFKARYSSGERISVPGGWYDAGDYGKYVVNGGITVATLLALYELYPGAVGDDLGIPESGNGVSDLLDEARWELDWFATMQDTDGGVFFKIASNSWSTFVQPRDDRLERFVIGKSTTSTLDFAGAMAQAGRVYASIDRAFADDCVGRARRAWLWAHDNPDVTAPTNELGSGPYGDTRYSDEFLWAAAELYITTGEDEYRSYIEKHLSGTAAGKAAWWQNVGNLALYSLATVPNGLNEGALSAIRGTIVKAADGVVASASTNPYRYPLDIFEWGSAGNVANCGVLLLYAYRITGDYAYLSSSAGTLDFILGRNPVGYTFITGVGKKSPRFPHHRPSGSDAWADPVPGLVVGGPNERMEDVAGGMVYGDTHPAKCYLDIQGSYSSNETAINQNAPVVFLMGALESESRR